MEKFFVAKLEEPDELAGPAARVLATRLVDIQFARRPPTFGALHLAELGPREQQTLKLSALQLTVDQGAKFVPLLELDLGAKLAAAGPEPASAKVVDFNTLHGQLLLEVSHSPSSLERLRSSCLALTQTGELFAISLLAADQQQAGACCCKRLLSQEVSAQEPGGELFVGLQLARAQDQLLEQQLAAKDQFAFQAHLLSERAYRHLTLRVRGAQLDCDIQSISKYSLQRSDPLARSLKFTRMEPLPARPSEMALVLLELNDHSRRFVRQGECLHAQAPSPRAQQLLILAPPPTASSRAGQTSLLLIEHFAHKLMASSLLIDPPKGVGVSGLQAAPVWGREEIGDEIRGDQPEDPDGLLPREPSFELEESWTIELADIDGIRARLVEESDEAEARGVAVGQWKPNGCLCALWPAEPAGPSGTKSPTSQDDLFGLGSTPTDWPKFLLVACYGHLLLYSCEHDHELPFPLVYDRAFLDVVPGQEFEARGESPSSESSSARTKLREARPVASKVVDARRKPRLVHNFKLLGSGPGDSLINTLFLAQRVHLNQLRPFQQLGLILGLTNEQHLLAFKLTARAVVKHRDNLYQQSLTSALRSPALLADELQRIQLSNARLRERLIGLDAGQQARNSAGGGVERAVSVELRRDELIGALYRLQLAWPALVRPKRLLLLATVHARLLTGTHEWPPKGSAVAVKSVESGHLGPDSRLAREALILSLAAGSQDDSATPKPLAQLNSMEGSIKSWALVELEAGTQLGQTPFGGGAATAAADPFGQEALALPLFLPDGQQFNGQLKVYFVFEGRAVPATVTVDDERGGQLIEAQTAALHPSQGSHEGQYGEGLGRAYGAGALKLPSKFAKRQLDIKPLQSYGPADELGQVGALELELGGSFGEDQMVGWLGECLEIDLLKLKQQIALSMSGRQTSSIRLAFSSNFSHCALVVQLHRRQGERQGPEGRVSIASDDFRALNLIERHLFRRATNESVQLTRAAGRPLVVGPDNLRNLIERQWLNVELYLSLRRQGQARAQLPGDEKRGGQIELVLENLMHEALELQSAPVRAELKQSTGWLERSFRQDLERVIGQEEEEPAGGHKGRLATFLDLVCGYIVDSLADFDQLHQPAASPASETVLLEMRSKLSRFVDELALGRLNHQISCFKFASRVMSDWLEVKKK